MKKNSENRVLSHIEGKICRDLLSHIWRSRFYNLRIQSLLKFPAIIFTSAHIQTCEGVCAASVSHPLPEPGLEPLLGGVEIVVHHLQKTHFFLSSLSSIILYSRRRRFGL
jgi:hypothetical protein